MVQPGIDTETGHSGLRFGFAPAAINALPASVTLSHSVGSTSTVFSAGILPSRIWIASATPAPPTEPGLVTAAPCRPATDGQLADKARVVRAHNRHQRRAGFDERINDHVVDAGGPDALERHARRDDVVDLLLALVLLPAGKHLLRHGDFREFGHRTS